MGQFVDRIIETDRKAREMIDAAQLEKKQILEDAKRSAAQQLAVQAQALEQGKHEADEQMAQKSVAANEAMDKAYLKAKHTLDTAFDSQRDVWLSEITNHILSKQQQ